MMQGSAASLSRSWIYGTCGLCPVCPTVRRTVKCEHVCSSGVCTMTAQRVHQREASHMGRLDFSSVDRLRRHRRTVLQFAYSTLL